jgi:hypothetical protein
MSVVGNPKFRIEPLGSGPFSRLKMRDSENQSKH